ncbi:MAG: DUF72 domain-containing protein [Dehalococcoidales bacterium]|nr:MAG: DUF72 domain-containing protein [Dehalococcoidales bacterium]
MMGKSGASGHSPQYYIGTSGWHYEHWRGRFYPEKLPRAGWLRHYAGCFNTVELNNSFYRLPSEKAFASWYESSPDGFVFSVKVSRYITHIKRLKDSGEAVDRFVTRAKGLKEKLGSLLYQLPPNMRRNDEVLKAFLSGLPPGLRHVIEFRHGSWLVEPVFDILHQHNTGFCVFDMPGVSCPLVATAGFAYIRFHGSEELYAGCYSDGELSGWAESLKELADGLEAVYVYFNNDAEAFAIRNAVTLRGLLETY